MKNTRQQTKKAAIRLNVSTPNTYTDKTTGEEKTHWTNVGSAFETERGIQVILNALPTTGKLFISEVKEN